MFKRKYPAISIHPTLQGQLEVDWQQEYNDEFHCPRCQTGKLTSFFRQKRTICNLGLQCNSCGKQTNLTQRVSSSPQKNLPISNHQTLNSILKVDWRREYQQEYNCPRCNKGKLTKYYCRHDSLCNLYLNCNCCRKQTYLTCAVPRHIFSYLPEVECPNPVCTDIGHDGQKGWSYKIDSNRCKCYFCQIEFNPNSVDPRGWLGSQTEKKLLPFSFDEDIWDLRHFYDQPNDKIVNFQKVNPYWYRQEVKKYSHYLLKSKAFDSTSSINNIVIALRQLGKTLVKFNLKNKT